MQTWEVAYTDVSGIPAETITRLRDIGNGNKTNFTIVDYDLFPGKTLNIRTTMHTPYYTEVLSNLESILVPPIASGKPYCGPCQLTDRTRCAQFNGVCWTDFMVYTITNPFNNTDCLKVMASECYTIWKATSLADTQCIDFLPYFNYTKMQIKPNVTGASYASNGKTITVTFTEPIYTVGFTDCTGIFEAATLNWLPTSKSARWVSSYKLEVDYDPQIGIMEEMQIKGGALYYDYPYSQESVSNGTIKVCCVYYFL